MVTFASNGLEKFRMKQAPTVPGSIADRIANTSYTFGSDTRDVMHAPVQRVQFPKSRAFSPESLQDPQAEELLSKLSPTLRLEAEQIAREAMAGFGEGGRTRTPSEEQLRAAVRAHLQSGNSELVRFFGGLGPAEIIIIGIIAVLLFGKRLPDVGRNVGRFFVELKKGAMGIEEELRTDLDQPNKPAAPETEEPKEEEGGGGTDGTQQK